VKVPGGTIVDFKTRRAHCQLRNFGFRYARVAFVVLSRGRPTVLRLGCCSQQPRYGLAKLLPTVRRPASTLGNAFGELLPRPIKAALLPDAATYLIPGSVRADRTLSVWLGPFSSQDPIDAFAESVAEQDQHFYAGSGYSSFDLRKLPLPDVQVGC